MLVPSTFVSLSHGGALSKEGKGRFSAIADSAFGSGKFRDFEFFSYNISDNILDNPIREDNDELSSNYR